MTLVAVTLCAVFVALAAIHFYWAAGGRLALAGAVPSADGKPLSLLAAALNLVGR